MAQKMAADWELSEANLSFEGPNEQFLYNRHNESIFDDVRYFPGLKRHQESVVKFDATNEDFINHATLRALVVQLTSPEVIDYNLICDFFLTYRTFTDSHTTMNLLLTRLIWSLQYINSFKQESEKIGKLVLLRTFVVLRHWILNYFIDDFHPDDKLCDTFSFFMNQITHESHLIRANMVFELKIITDLKIHWLSQLNEFYKAGIALDGSQSIFDFVLPQVGDLANSKKLSKSNTEASIHTNPSFRRSAMLSLYDQKIYHKCLIYDDSNANDENPQLSIKNLLSQHQSSRTSLNDKLKYFQGKGSKKWEKKVLSQKQNPNAAKHNYMNLTDSSLALKKTTNLLDDSDEKFDDSDKENGTPVGFSTSGHVKLPSSKVTEILPLTPAKKMEYTLRKELPPTPKMGSESHLMDGFDLDDFGRKKSLKKIVDGFKRSFNSPDLKSDKKDFSEQTSSNTPAVSPRVDSENVIGQRVDVLSARIIDELEYLIRFYFTNQNTIDEADDKDLINRSVIECSRMEDKEGKTAGQPEFENDDGQSLRRAQTMTPLGSKSQMSIQDLSELNIDKIDNLFSQHDISVGEDDDDERMYLPSDKIISQTMSMEADNSKRSSFAGRIASINWNDEGDLNLEVSQLLENIEASQLMENELDNLKHELKEDNFISERMIKTSTQYFDVSSEIQGLDDIERPTTPSSISTPSDIEGYHDEVADLGIAMSPQSLQKKVCRISLNEQVSNMNKRYSLMSRNSSGSQLKRESMKSYISYDSAFSITSNSKSADLEGNLRKKHGYQNLRKFANAQDVSPDASQSRDVFNTSTDRLAGIPFKLKTTSYVSHRSRSSSMRRSYRLSTLCALTELPFNDFTDSTLLVIKNNNDFDKSRKLSDIADSSVFSCVIARRKSTLDSTRKSSDHSMSSLAIPGISSYDLRELAAIPDDSFSKNNPVQSALCRLEGKKSSKENTLKIGSDEDASPTVLENQLNEDILVHDSESDTSIGKENEYRPDLEDFEFNNTEDILAEINNAATEDVIDYSSEVEQELRDKPVTPIKTVSKAFIMPSSSTSNMNALMTGVPNSENTSPFSLLNPKIVLDGYALTSPALSIKTVIENGSHISFVLSFSSLSLAEHLTMIEKDMLQEIDWKELIELKWNKELTPVNSWLEIIVNESYYNKNKGVNLVIARFNLMVNWVISEILLTRTEEEQISIVSRFIHIAHHCLEMQNFSTLMQIVLALTSEKVAKLKSTWNNLPPGDILTLKNLEEITSPSKNFVKIRLCTNQLKPSRGCIPFVGLYLSDLVFNAERPKFVKIPTAPATNRGEGATFAVPPSTNEPTSAYQTPTLPPSGEFADNASTLPADSPMLPPSNEDAAAGSPKSSGPHQTPANVGNDSLEQSVTYGDSTMGTEMTSGEADKLINFSRFRTSVHIVKSLSQCIEWSKYYHFQVNDELLRKCLYIKSLDEEEMNYCLETLNI